MTLPPPLSGLPRTPADITGPAPAAPPQPPAHPSGPTRATATPSGTPATPYNRHPTTTPSPTPTTPTNSAQTTPTTSPTPTTLTSTPYSTPATRVLAVDIGGTKLAVALVDASGELLRRGEVPTPDSTDGPVVVGALLELIAHVAEGVAPAAVGVGSAGPIDPVRGTVSPVNIPAWRDFPLLDHVRAAVPGVPVVLIGDAVAAAVGEHWRGAGTASTALLGIVVSTGIGGGLVLDSRSYPGPTGNAGHFGHIVADPLGPECPCGARGCVEAIASGPAMTRWALANGWRPGEPGPSVRPIGARELAADARAGAPVAVAAFERGAAALAAGIVSVAAICDLDQVVVGGGVSRSGEILLGPLRRQVAAQSHLGFVRRLRVTPAALGGDAGLVGAARAALSALSPSTPPPPSVQPVPVQPVQPQPVQPVQPVAEASAGVSAPTILPEIR
ncbi:ROK family protein [Streptosporangium sp. KLBMP 9127]|nr:ROK family protein [Streptosporangium sp. KLBMP 9127]